MPDVRQLRLPQARRHEGEGRLEHGDGELAGGAPGGEIGEGAFHGDALNNEAGSDGALDL